MKKKKYLNKYSRENNYKKFTTLTYITCFIMVLFTTIGYSAMNRAVLFYYGTFYNNWLFCNE